METFVVRVWVPADAEAGRPPDVLRGFVQHARNGGGASFASGDELLASLDFFLGARTGDVMTAEHERTTTGGMK
jgi:hypothetical protein